MGRVSAWVAAAEFRLGAPEAATSKQIDETLAAERAHRARHPGDVIVIVLPARLALTAPIVLGADDSGRPQAPLILRGAGGGGSTISGATALDAESARQAIRTDLAAFLRDEVRRHGCRLSGAEVDGLLENDVALNTDGLLVWLSRRKS